jgi:nicotinamide riboside kinase
MNTSTIRIALIGPESSGKTTLCMELSRHFRSPWVPEFAREFISSLNRAYTEEDILSCTMKQEQIEDELLSKSPDMLFSDTEEIIASVWLNHVFKKDSSWLQQQILKRKFNLYLLTSPDITFIPDPVRENPDRRDYFFNYYKEELDKRKFYYKIISGSEKSRTEDAINLVEQFLNGMNRH